MTDNEIRIAIAECCGWKPTEMQAAGMLAGVPFWTDGEKFCPAEHLPDYPNSLDVMHEAEERFDTASVDVQSMFLDYLYCTVGWDDANNALHAKHKCYYGSVRATARQRAEAFLRTIGKWKE